jgi:hypothetical protein
MTATLDAVAAEKSKPEPTPEERAAEELVRRAQEQGLWLTGPDGLLKQLTKMVLETALGVIAFGKALYGTRTALGPVVAELAMRAALTDDDTEPAMPLLRRLAAALNADVRLTAGHDLGSVWFETHAA